MENEFDYAKAIAELEEMAQKVEDPSAGLDDIDKYIERTDKLVSRCREYLRSARASLDEIDK